MVSKVIQWPCIDQILLKFTLVLLFESDNQPTWSCIWFVKSRSKASYLLWFFIVARPTRLSGSNASYSLWFLFWQGPWGWVEVMHPTCSGFLSWQGPHIDMKEAWDFITVWWEFAHSTHSEQVAQNELNQARHAILVLCLLVRGRKEASPLRVVRLWAIAPCPMRIVVRLWTMASCLHCNSWSLDECCKWLASRLRATNICHLLGWDISSRAKSFSVPLEGDTILSPSLLCAARPRNWPHYTSAAFNDVTRITSQGFVDYIGTPKSRLGKCLTYSTSIRFISNS